MTFDLASSKPVLGPGTRVAGRYVVLRMLGYGGMGQVFEVEHEAIGRHFALKILNLSPCTDEILRRFQREARALGRVATPRVAQVTDSGYEPGLGPYYVMEMLDGETLEARLEREGRLPVHEALPIAVELAEALDEVHEAGIVHRDLKPSNVGLCRGGAVRVKLLDFGLAAATDDAMLERITRSQEVVGSLPYMAPERFNNEPPTIAVDLYALGVVLYEALAGRLPHHGASAAGLISAHLNNEPPSLSEVAPEQEIPPSVEAVVARLLAKDPRDRFVSAGATARALRAASMDVPAPTLVDGEPDGEGPTLFAPGGDEAAARTLEEPGPPSGLGGAGAFHTADAAAAGPSATVAAMPPTYLTTGVIGQPTTPAQAIPLPAPPGPTGLPPTVFAEPSVGAAAGAAAPSPALAPTAMAPPAAAAVPTGPGREGWTTGQPVPPTAVPTASVGGARGGARC